MVEFIALGLTILGMVAGYLIREGIHRREHMWITEVLDKHGVEIDRNTNRHNQNDVVVATILTKLDFIADIVRRSDDRLERIESKGN